MNNESDLLPNGEVKVDPGKHAQSVMDPDWASDSSTNPFDCTPEEIQIIASLMGGATKKQAGIDAGYTGRYPTRWVASVMMRDHVQNEMQRHTRVEAQGLTYDPAKVLHRLVMIAEANTVDALIVNRKATKLRLANLANLPEPLKYAIKTITFSESGMVKIEFYDKLKALDLIGRFFNMWSPDSARGGAGAGEGGQVIEEHIVYEKRMDQIGEVIHGRIDRVIRNFEAHRDIPRTPEPTVD